MPYQPALKRFWVKNAPEGPHLLANSAWPLSQFCKFSSVLVRNLRIRTGWSQTDPDEQNFQISDRTRTNKISVRFGLVGSRIWRFVLPWFWFYKRVFLPTIRILLTSRAPSSHWVWVSSNWVLFMKRAPKMSAISGLQWLIWIWILQYQWVKSFPTQKMTNTRAKI